MIQPVKGHEERSDDFKSMWAMPKVAARISFLCSAWGDKNWGLCYITYVCVIKNRSVGRLYNINRSK